MAQRKPRLEQPNLFSLSDLDRADERLLEARMATGRIVRVNLEFGITAPGSSAVRFSPGIYFVDTVTKRQVPYADRLKLVREGMDA